MLNNENVLELIFMFFSDGIAVLEKYEDYSLRSY